MKKRYVIIIVLLILACIAIILYSYFNNEKSNIEENIQTEELEKLKELFEEYSVVKVYIKDGATIEDVDTLYDNIKGMSYFKNVELVTSLDAYQKMVEQYGEDSDLVKSIDKYSLQESIWAGCYYLDDISLLDEDSYFEKIKSDVYKIDENGIIDNIVTAGIINIYNDGGMEAVNEYVEKVNSISSTVDTNTEDTKNYDKDMKIAYENEEDKENSKLVYLNDNNKTDYNWNEYIVENKTILKDMPDVDFAQFEELDNDFYCLKITDYATYQKMAEDYNLRTLDKSDFDNIFVEIIIRKSSDNSIKCENMVKGYEFINNEENYTIPVTVGGALDVSENFKYPCIIGYFPNYMNEHYSDFFFKVLAVNEDITVSKDNAVTIAQNYLKDLTYGGCYNFSNMDYVRIENRYANNFLNTDEKENPIDDTSKKYTVWSVSAYSENDPCTWANVYVDVTTGKIIGGNLNFATD